MRTTVTLADDVFTALKETAHRTGKPFKQVVDEAIRAGLAASRRPRPKRYRLVPAHLGGVLPGIDLDRALGLADDLEDTEIARKLALRK
ncbi:MAG: DUF2191 domain-containing protein [Thermoanaerobaculia bacterium]|nr:DUF2191 domain-containing protein [Thermoanaerobaculia bacterium]